MKLNDTLSMATLAAGTALLLAGCGDPATHGGDDGHDHSGHARADHATSAPTLADSQPHGDLCQRHGAPATRCFICEPGVRDKDRLWCGGHERYEDRCWTCHPELRDPDRPFCEQHGLYEDECFYCNPTSAVADPHAGHEHSSGVGLFCDEHGLPEAQCGICRPDAVAELEPGESLKVRLPSKESAAVSGVRTGRAAVGRIGEGVGCYAELAFDQNKLAQVVAPVRGIVQKVPVDLGHRVEENQTVAHLWSAEIAAAVAEAVLAHQTLDRERRLREQRVSSEQDLQKAEANHRAACHQLRTYGFTEERIDALGHNTEESVLLDVRAPFAGEVIERQAVRGELAETGDLLFTIADRSVMWAMLNIPETRLANVQVGQAVELEVDAIPGRRFMGTLTWISAEVDDRSRMIRARAEVPNPDGVLRAKMFAKATILTRTSAQALLLPTSAVQQVEGEPLVFVKLEDDLFEARRIGLGARANGQVEVTTGLAPEEVVAVDRVFPLKSQLLISRLGAGCAHE